VCISGKGPNCIARIEGRFGSKQYVDLLNEYIFLPPKSPDLMPISKLGNAIVSHVNSSVQNDIKNNSDLYKAIAQSFQTICARLSFQNFFIEISETIKTISESGGH